MKTLFKAFFIILLPLKVFGQSSCLDVLKSSDLSESRDVSLFSDSLSRLEQALLAVKKAQSEGSLKPTKEELKGFKSNDSSYKAIANFDGTRHSTSGYFLMLAAFDIFSLAETPSEDDYREFMRLSDLSDTILPKREMLSLYKASKKNKTRITATNTLAYHLKGYSLFLSTYFSRPIDLFKQSELFEVFSIAKRNDLPLMLSDMSTRGNEIIGRIESALDIEYDRHTIDVVYEIIEHFTGDPNHSSLFKTSERGNFMKGPSLEDGQMYIKALRLSKDREEHYLEGLALLRIASAWTSDEFSSNRFTAALIAKAADESSITQAATIIIGKIKEKKRFLYSHSLNILNIIKNIIIKRELIEEEMSRYVENVETLNRRVETVKAKLLDLDVREASGFELRESLLIELDELLVADFNEDIQVRFVKLDNLAIRIDQLIEATLRNNRNEAIEEFRELNNRWRRLIAGKSYKINGLDFDEVSFDKSVVDFFAKDMNLGSRFLVHLTLEYVAVRAQSGLRRFPSIHPQMRDIKIIKSHGKIRLVGKLIGRRIYFHYVYDSEKPYNNKDMKKKTEDYSVARSL